MKNIKLYLEAIQTMNSDKEVKIKDYQDKVNDYNTNKTKFTSILATKKMDQWEDEANKIINGNVYLAEAWKLAKIQNNIKQNTDKLNSTEISADEKKTIQLDLNKNKQDLTKQQAYIADKIKDDLKALQQL